jgi:hypothetical protein
MTVKNASGTAVTKADLDTTAFAADDPEFTVNERIYEETEIPGSTRLRKRLLAREGDRVKQSDIDRWFPEATVTGVSPATGAAAGGTAIIVTGTNLRGVTAVKIGGTNCTGTLVATETRITGAVTPAKAAGAHAVTVVDDSGETDNTTPTFTTS